MASVNDAQLVEPTLLRGLENPLIVPEIGRQREALLGACREASPHSTPPVLPRQRVRNKMLEGIPLLHQETFDLDPEACQRLFRELVESLARLERDHPGPADLRRSLTAGRLDTIRAVDEAMAGHADHLDVLADWSGSPSLLLAGVAALAVRPSLQSLASRLALLLGGGAPWIHGYCPICGTCPSLTLEQPGDRESVVCCLRCLSVWSFPRGICLYCRSEGRRLVADSMALAVGRVWVEGCDACGAYLKVLAPLSPATADSLLVADVDSAGLERLARERGWIRCPSGAFRLELGEEEIDEALADLLEAD